MCSKLPKQRTWGFRFLATDAIVIGAFIAAICALWRIGHPLGWMIAIVAMHFFLFCNVFRVRRRYEMVWAATFSLNVMLWLYFGHLRFTAVLACQLPITLACIAAEMCSRQYHGILATRINRESTTIWMDG